MAASDQKTTYNQDVAGLYRRVNSFLVELYKSASSGVHAMSSFDQARLQSYIDAINKYVAWIAEAPQLDLPETHPRTILLDVDPVMSAVENQAVNDVIYMLQIARDELAASQSSRNAAGLISFDQVRFLAVISKVQKYLTDFIQKALPVDMPESSPSEPMSGPGQTGV